MRMNFALAALGLVGVLAAGPAALAQAPFPEAVARQDVMKANNAANRALAPIARGEQPWNQSVAVQQADILAGNAAKLGGMFPAGTGPEKGVTNALPAIWQNSADFQAKAKAFTDETAALLRLARANDEAGFKAQFPKVGQTCGGCHNPYRKPLN